jgi:transposase
MNRQRRENSRRIAAALPGTSADISRRSGVGIGTVRRYLRAWKANGEVRQCTRWIGKNAYTFVYKAVAEKPEG